MVPPAAGPAGPESDSITIARSTNCPRGQCQQSENKAPFQSPRSPAALLGSHSARTTFDALFAAFHPKASALSRARRCCFALDRSRSREAAQVGRRAAPLTRFSARPLIGSGERLLVRLTARRTYARRR